MIQNILNSNFVKGTKVLGIDYFINSDGQIDLNCVLLSQKKGKILIEKLFDEITSIDQLNDDDLKSLPVILSVDGKGVLFRISEQVKNQKLIHHILPNAKEEDFYLQSVPANDNKIVISAIRKEVLNAILDKLKQIGMQVYNLYVGPLAVNNLQGIINESLYCTQKYEISQEAGLIESIIKLAEPKLNYVQIGDDEVTSESILAYSTALGFYLSDSDSELIETVEESKKEYLYKRGFVKAGWFSLAFFFTLLMINFFFFNTYNSKLNQLTFSYNQNKELLKKLESLKDEYLIKEQYFVNTGFLDASRLSYYADRIAYSMPKNITLSGMEINPLNTKIKEEKILGFSMNKIRISGSVSQSIILNNWLKKLKKLEWIENVDILEYNQELASVPAIFELEIDIE